MNNYINKHTAIILIALICCVTFIGLKVELEEPFESSNDANKHTKCNSNNKQMGWKDFWKTHYSTFDNNLEKVFNTPPVNSILKPLRYDGIYTNTVFN